MASLVNPACSVPLYQMTSEQTARDCGRLNGYFFAGVLTAIILGVTLYMYYKSGQTKDVNTPVDPAVGADPSTEPQKRNWIILVAGAVGIVLVWVLVPVLGGWFSARRYQGFVEQVGSLMKQGYSKTQAYSKIQSLQQTKMQADATIEAGEEIASAFRG